MSSGRALPSRRKLCHINRLKILETILKLQMRSHDSGASVFYIEYSLAAILDFYQTARPIKIPKKKSLHSE